MEVKMNKKNILMCVSGGYDSTYLLIKNLQNGDNVYPVYVHVSCIYPIKQRIEITNVRRLIKKLKRKYNNLHDLVEKEMRIEPIRDIFSTQPIFWMLALFNEVRKQRHIFNKEEAEVQIGYIATDGAIDYIHEIKAYWKALFSFSDPSPKWTIPKLCFPLLKYNKTQIIKKLENYDKEILASCWTCENPKVIKTKRRKDNTIEMYVEACGSCPPCENLQNIDNISFNLIKKYRIVFNKNDFHKALGTYEKRTIKRLIYQCLPNDLFKVEEVDNTHIAKIKKQLKKKEQLKDKQKKKKKNVVIDI
jgi:7-cyano-7-deazaguanine synthase in queuosine biosynthesis